MARVLIEGFESGDLKSWVTHGSCDITAAKEGMSGNSCMRLYNSGSWALCDFPAASSYYFAGKVQHENSLYPNKIYFQNSGDEQVHIVFKEDYPLEVKRGNTSLATGIKTIPPLQTHLIEIYVFISDSSGRVIVKVNGITDIDFTGDTQNISGNNLINQIRFYVGNYYKTYWDDIIIDDSNWIGETRIMGLSPTGAGATTQWTPSTGSNWQNVDEKPADDADYNSVNEVDKIDTFTIEDMSSINGIVNNIKCIQVQARASKDGTPTPQNLNLVVRIGGSNYFSADKEVPTDFETLYNIWEKNPNSGVDWTESGINAMEIGYKSKA